MQQPIPTAAERRLTAIKVLHYKIANLEKDRKAAANEHGKAEKEALERRDELIEEAAPSAKASRDRLLELQQAHARLKTVRGDKKRDLDSRAQKIAEFEGFLTEAIVASIDVEQQSLDLGDSMSLAPGLALTPGALKAIGAAANDHVSKARSEDKDADADVADLLGTITSMGLAGMSLGSDMSVAVSGDAVLVTSPHLEENLRSAGLLDSDAETDPETEPADDPPF